MISVARRLVEGRPRVLGVRVGVNPNSSSLGIDVTMLLLGGAGSLAVSLALSALLRGRALFARARQVGEPAAPEVGTKLS